MSYMETIKRTSNLSLPANKPNQFKDLSIELDGTLKRGGFPINRFKVSGPVDAHSISTKSTPFGQAVTSVEITTGSALNSAIEVETTFNGSTGPDINLYHNSPSPSRGNDIGSLSFDGNSDTLTRTTYGYKTLYIADPTSTARSSYFVDFLRDDSGLRAAHVLNLPLTEGTNSQLTNSIANNILNVIVASNTYGGGTVNWTVTATNGTDFQTLSGITTWAAVNKGGTFTTDIDTTGSSVACSTGTLTGTWSIGTSGSTVTLKFTPSSSLATTSINMILTANTHRGSMDVVL